VKHGIAARTTPGTVRLHAQSLPEGIRITVSDDGKGFHDTAGRASNGAHVGLDNVRQRLRLCFGDAAPLQIESSDDGSTVSFLVPTPVREGVVV